MQTSDVDKKYIPDNNKPDDQNNENPSPEQTAKLVMDSPMENQYKSYRDFKLEDWNGLGADGRHQCIKKEMYHYFHNHPNANNKEIIKNTMESIANHFNEQKSDDNQLPNPLPYEVLNSLADSCKTLVFHELSTNMQPLELNQWQSLTPQERLVFIGREMTECWRQHPNANNDQIINAVMAPIKNNFSLPAEDEKEEVEIPWKQPTPEQLEKLAESRKRLGVNSSTLAKMSPQKEKKEDQLSLSNDPNQPSASESPQEFSTYTGRWCKHFNRKLSKNLKRIPDALEAGKSVSKVEDWLIALAVLLKAVYSLINSGAALAGIGIGKISGWFNNKVSFSSQSHPMNDVDGPGNNMTFQTNGTLYDEELPLMATNAILANNNGKRPINVINGETISEGDLGQHMQYINALLEQGAKPRLMKRDKNGNLIEDTETLVPGSKQTVHDYIEAKYNNIPDTKKLYIKTKKRRPAPQNNQSPIPNVNSRPENKPGMM